MNIGHFTSSDQRVRAESNEWPTRGVISPIQAKCLLFCRRWEPLYVTSCKKKFISWPPFLGSGEHDARSYAERAQVEQGSKSFPHWINENNKSINKQNKRVYTRPTKETLHLGSFGSLSHFTTFVLYLLTNSHVNVVFSLFSVSCCCLLRSVVTYLLFKLASVCPPSVNRRAIDKSSKSWAISRPYQTFSLEDSCGFAVSLEVVWSVDGLRSRPLDSLNIIFFGPSAHTPPHTQTTCIETNLSK